MKTTRIKIHDELSKTIARERLDKLPADGSVYVEFGSTEETRSKAQNRLMWKWLGIFGEHAGYTKQQAHDVFCSEINGVEIVKDLHGVNREIIKGTRNMTVKEMAYFLQQVECICTQIGCYLPIPDDYAYIMGDK